MDDAVLAELVEYVRRQIAGLADEIIAGNIAVAPYLIGRDTPCQQCDLQRVCRIDRTVNRYRPLKPMARDEAIELIRGTKGTGRGD